jgi:hypothetical protein
MDRRGFLISLPAATLPPGAVASSTRPESSLPWGVLGIGERSARVLAHLIVRSECSGIGFGIVTWQADHTPGIEDARKIALDGTVETIDHGREKFRQLLNDARGRFQHWLEGYEPARVKLVVASFMRPVPEYGYHPLGS